MSCCLEIQPKNEEHKNQPALKLKGKGLTLWGHSHNESWPFSHIGWSQRDHFPISITWVTASSHQSRDMQTLMLLKPRKKTNELEEDNCSPFPITLNGSCWRTDCQLASLGYYLLEVSGPRRGIKMKNKYSHANGLISIMYTLISSSAGPSPEADFTWRVLYCICLCGVGL